MDQRAAGGAGDREAAGQGARLTLRILASSDLHANLLAWDYHSNRPAPQRGLAGLATLIAAARAEVTNCLLVDNGDFLHGTALGDHLAAPPPGDAPRRRRSGLHPMIAAMNHLGYDAATLGNHEFSHGLGFLRRSLAGATFPVVASNLVFKPGRAAPLALPSLLLRRSFRDAQGRRHPLCIGILGFLPPQTMIWERRHLRGRAMIDDILAAARHLVPELRRAGADLVLALSHSGIGEPGSAPGAENASSALARLPGIDVVIAGHTHLTFPDTPGETLAGTPAVMPGLYGSHLGVIDLALQRGARGWQVTRARASLRPVARRDPVSGRVWPLVAEDPAIAGLAQPAHARLLAEGERVIGATDLPLHSAFALLSDTPALRLVAEAQACRVRAALQGGPHGDLPVLSAVAPFRAGGRGGPENYTDIPAGPLCRRHLGDLYPHPNSLAALRVTGAELALWLERSFSLFHAITPGASDAALIDDRFPGFNFDTIHGLTWQVDLAAPPRFDPAGHEIDPARRRIRDLRFQGRPIDRDQAFALATNSYRSAGGAGFAGAVPAQVILDSGEDVRDVLAAHLQGGARPEPVSQPPWRFLAMPGTSAVFDTTPAAQRHLHDLPHLALEPLGLQPSGFRRFRLHLASAISGA